jgi:hypothetical protein
MWCDIYRSFNELCWWGLSPTLSPFLLHVQIKFQRIYVNFRYSPIENRIQRRTAKSTDIRKLRWRLETGSSYNFGLEQDIDAISTVMPYFRCLPVECRVEWHTTTPTDTREQRWWLRNWKYVRFDIEPDARRCRCMRHSIGDIERMRTAVGITSLSCSKPKL